MRDVTASATDMGIVWCNSRTFSKR